MKKLLVLYVCLACLTLNAFTTGFNPVEYQGFSTLISSSDEMQFSSQNSLSTYLAKGFKGFKGGRRGKKLGPSSKRKDPNQANRGNKKGSEHKINQTESNRPKHESAETRRNKEQAKASDKNDQRHGKQA